jgi:molybdenum cofactor cytidylyltransferase
MPPRADGPVCGLVLAAGSSNRLGSPKQLLPYGSSTLLEHVLEDVRAFPFDQLVCVIAAHAAPVRAAVERSAVDAVENPDQGDGCSSSIAAGLRALRPDCAVAVLMLGDQPGVSAETVASLLRGRGDAAIAVCSYRDGRGHPLAFARALFGELSELHGDRGVWRLLDRHAAEVAEVAIESDLPRDVDTWADYEALLAQAAAR